MTTPQAHATSTTKTSKTQQVADALREDIQSGALPAGTFVPSEAELQARFGVSRGTARNAIALLGEWGLVATAHGKGSIVRRISNRPTHTHTRAPGRDADSGEDYTPVEQPGTYRTDATADVALTLGLSEGAPVFVYDRLLANRAGQRMFHRLYLPFAVASDTPELEANPFLEPRALYAALTDAGHQIDWIEYVRARTPSPDDIHSLNLPPSTPMLQTWRVTRTTGGQPLALEEARFSADDTQLAYPLT
jgi:GntR family transcriptional regulator